MARKARIDTPGAIQHVVARGIERSRIFRERGDYLHFLARLEAILTKTGATCCAWSLLPNHIHLVIRTGRVPLARVMHRLLLGYCTAFNSKYGRKGHLFEGRYRSVLCEEERYLMELVRYVHLNPVRAGVVKSVPALARYPWCGHAALLGREERPWQETAAVLKRFGGDRTDARRRYVEFLEQGLAGDEEKGVKIESLRRLVEGGWQAVKGAIGADKVGTDESIMGGNRFIKSVLKETEEQERWKSQARRRMRPAQVIEKAARQAGISVQSLKGPGKIPAQCRARALACYWLVGVMGMKEVEVARLLGITQSAVSINIPRGESLAREKGIKFLGRP